MNTELYNRINNHGEKLNAIFNTGIDPVKLCKKLFKIENKLHSESTDYCNAAIDTDQWELSKDKAIKSLDNILNFKNLNVPVFINSDPRGYALKIDDEYMRAHNIDLPRDWGGYGLIAPDLREV